MSHFADYRSHTGSSAPKFFKATLFRSDSLLLGLNCLDPGQAHGSHSHEGQDKFYFVVEGEGEFTVGDETRQAGPGTVIWAPAGVDHGVANRSDQRLVVLLGIAPAPSL